jgi:NADPH:quinone reductase-like Zn-dependent oxidoreductase
VTVGSTAMVMPGPGAPLEPVARDVPDPGPGQAVVRIRASSLNYHDIVNLAGLLQGPWPRVPLSDGAGEVVAIGPGVRKLAVGDRVTAAFHPSWLQGPPTPAAKRSLLGDSMDGCLQQHLLIDATALVRTPDHLTDAEAATIPCAGVTAWSAVRIAEPKPGDVVVAQGTGGVSMWVVLLAKAHGAQVVLTSSSDEKLEVGRALGADHLVNRTRTPDWHEAVRAFTGGRGADLVVDVGGPGSLGRSVLGTRMGGTVAIVGALGGYTTPAEIPVGIAMTQNIRLIGVTVGSVVDHTDLCRAVATSGIRPHISHTVAWDHVPEGVRLMEANGHVGKIAVEIP